MAIKLADTARPNNYVDAEHLGTYPVAYAEDIWFEDGTRLSEKTFDGQSIQKEELPLASADELGNIYQYVGVSGTYEHGYFYECVQTSTSPIRYGWVLTPEKPKTIIDVETIPDTDIKNVFYRTPNRGETQSINVDVHTELENQRFEIVRQRVIDAGFTVTKNQGDYFTYTMTYPTPLYVNTYSLQTGWLIPEGLQLEDTTIGGVATPTIRIYWSDGTHNYSVSIRYYGDSPAVFEYADPTPSALWVGNEEEQTVTKLDDGQSFIGTQAEWDALSQAEKAEYDGKIVNIIDDESSSATEEKIKEIADEEANKLLNAQSATTDCNTTLKVGVYACSMQTVNKPSNVDYGVLLVFGQRTEFASPSVQWIYQFFYETAGRIYKRYCINPSTLTPSSSQWTSWELIAGGVEQISNPFTVNTDKSAGMLEVGAFKQGRVVQFKVYIESFKNIVSGSWNTLGTVSDTIKPITETPVSMSDGRAISATALTRITPSGELQIWGSDDLNTLSSRFFVTYFSAN